MLNFQGQISNWLYLSQKWSDCHETKSKHIDWALGFKCNHQVWPWPWIIKVKCQIGYISAKNGAIATKRKANISIDLKTSNVTTGLTLAMTLTLNFQSQMQNWLYLCQKWSDCHKTKSKHINWTLGLKCDHQIWPWPWPWPWIFKVKYEICYISTKSGPTAMKQKAANLSIWTWGLKCDNGIDLGHDVDILFLMSYVILTIWWPRIYQIVTGVTSDVGVLSTHLVLLKGDSNVTWLYQLKCFAYACSCLICCSLCTICFIFTYSHCILSSLRNLINMMWSC